MRLTSKQAANAAAVFQAIGEPTRVQIIDILAGADSKTVTEISEQLKLPIVNVSHHLGKMRSAGLVDNVKDGRFVRYSLSEKGREIIGITANGISVEVNN